MTSDTHLHSDLLDAVGVTPHESLVYRALIDRPYADLDSLVCAVALPRSDVAGIVNQLVGKGLVSRSSGVAARYTAISPEEALEPLIAEQEAQLQATKEALADLTISYQSARANTPTELVEIVNGGPAIHQQFHRLQRLATTEMLVLTKPPFIGRVESNDPELDLLDRGVAVRSIYDREALESHTSIDAVRQFVDAGEQARVTEHLPAKLVIVDAQTALMPLVVDQEQQLQSHALLVHRCALLESLVELFETLWTLSTPLHVDVPASDPMVHGRPEPRVDDRQLLAMMFAGLTDAAIAKQLDSSPRTVQRHIRRLMDRYGARGRFHLGAIARQRGLLG